jgi:AcrR family transcriptional regulator
MTRLQPVQRRSRERVERIVQAAVEVLSERGLHGLTTRAIAARSEIPVATIYRYFANRDEIIAAYLEREMDQIEQSVLSAVSGLERVTIRSVVETAALAHMHHHQQHPEGVPLWFGGRASLAVVEKVRQLDARLALVFRAAMSEIGMLRAHGPKYRAELLMRLFDRMFEFVFLAERSAREQRAIVLEFADMIASHLERSAAPAGLEGVPAAEFVAALSSLPARDARAAS